MCLLSHRASCERVRPQSLNVETRKLRVETRNLTLMTILCVLVFERTNRGVAPHRNQVAVLAVSVCPEKEKELLD